MRGRCAGLGLHEKASSRPLAVSLILLVGLLVAPRAQEPRAPEGKILVAAAEIFGDVEFARPSRGHRLRA